MSKQLPVPAKRILPSKEATLFKELLAFYENRSLKKGIKIADQILKKFPEHGETVCMKGLLLTHIGRREEGIDLVKKGMRLDLTSHICWHVFGLIQKGEKNYEEALKSYTQALKFDRENMNILLDAANLQTQLRLFDSLVETRYTILRVRPNIRKYWVAYALAHHLNGNPAEARKPLEQYLRMVKSVPEFDVEHSETLLYYVRVLEEVGAYDAAVEALNEGEKNKYILDRTAALEARARVLSKSKSSEAAAAWRSLIEYNSDCLEYYYGYLADNGLSLDDPSNAEECTKILKQLAPELPKATAPRRLALNSATNDEFHVLAKEYIYTALKKGIPSLFSDLKSLYKDPSKKQAIESILESAKSEFAATPAPEPKDSDEPTTYLWTLYYLAQHRSYLGQYPEALLLVDTALTHTPTLPELYTCKARLLKRSGDLIGAAQAMDEARILDGQDRFLNTKTAKYYLRAGLSEHANQMLGLFTKKDAVSPSIDLEEMQSVLYLTEEAESQYNAGKLHLALKKYTAIQKLFEELNDDQFDFHGYALRRFTINIYLNLVKWEDKLHSDPTYIKAAIEASKIFITVHDDPSIAAKLSAPEPVTGAEKKAKKKAKRVQKIEELKKGPTPQKTNEDKGLEPPPPADDDTDGKKLIACPDPLEKAAKWLQPIVALVPQNLDVWLAAYDVAIRRKKLLQAIKALNHARALDPEGGEVHERIVDFVQRVAALPQTPPSPIGPILESFRSSLFPTSSSASPSDTAAPPSLDVINSQYLQKHSASPLAILSAARVSAKLGVPVEQVEETAFLSLRDEVKGLTWKTAQKIHNLLASLPTPSARADEYRLACAQRFTLSTVFKPAEEYQAWKATITWGPQPPEGGSGGSGNVAVGTAAKGKVNVNGDPDGQIFE